MDRSGRATAPGVGARFAVTVVRAGDDEVILPVATDAADAVPAEVELVFPQPGDRVLRQTSVMADLIPGYTGKLIIDDQDIGVVEVQAADKVQPGQEVNGGIVVTKFDLGSNTLTYEPKQGGPIAQFAPGPHRVTLVYWRIDLGPDSSRSHTWEFNITG